MQQLELRSLLFLLTRFSGFRDLHHHRHEDHGRRHLLDHGHRRNLHDDADRHGLHDLPRHREADRLLDAPVCLRLRFHGLHLRD